MISQCLHGELVPRWGDGDLKSSKTTVCYVACQMIVIADIIFIMWVVPRLHVHGKSNLVSLLSMCTLVTYVTHTRFSVFKHFSVDRWKRYENGSVDTDLSRRFRFHRERSQIKTHCCWQGLSCQVQRLHRWETALPSTISYLLLFVFENKWFSLSKLINRTPINKFY